MAKNRGTIKKAKSREKLKKDLASDVYDQVLKSNKKEQNNSVAILVESCSDPTKVEEIRGYHKEKAFAKAIKKIQLKEDEQQQVLDLIDVCTKCKILGKNKQDYIEPLTNLVSWQAMWQNDPAQWKPKSKNVHKQFISLVKFLLCKYDVPRFMDKCWYSIYTTRRQEWYINLGQGENIRKQIGLPFPLTKKMAHIFPKAPADLDIERAFRWCQMMAMGGDKRTIMGVLGTPLGTSFVNMDFWDSVVRFFIASPMLDVNQYGPMYDYIRNQKYTPQGNVFVNNEVVHLGPPQPNFSMHRRDGRALLRQVEAWHRKLSKESYKKANRNIQWKSCGISGYEKKGKNEAYTIEELLTSKDLYAEGQAQRSCIGSYVTSCENYRTAVYSLRRYDKMGMVREATISINLRHKMIDEARKKCNAQINNSDLNRINEWAKKENITISSWI